MEQVPDGDKTGLDYPLAARGLTFSFPDAGEPLFSGVDLRVRSGEVVTIMGLSGSGKTTLCHCLSGIIPLIRPGQMSGDVLVEGVSTRQLTVPEVASRLGIVFQDPDTQLFFPAVEDEIAFGPENLCVPPAEIELTVQRVMHTVGLPEELRHRNPHHLSGGQKQLVALASVLSLQPQILIFDEVMSQLDADGKKRIRRLIRELAGEGKAVVTVEHDPDNLDIADRVKVLHDGQLVDYQAGWPYCEGDAGRVCRD